MSADCFPLLLDFIYSHNANIEVTSNNAIPLRQLAKRFEVKPLASKVAQFVRSDLNVANVSVYITKAALCGDNTVLQLASDTCAMKINDIELSHPLWAVMDPQLFLQVLSSPLIPDRFETSARLSLLLVEYHSLHKYEIEAKTFKAMTAEEIIPVIDRKAALAIVEISEEYGIVEHFIPLQRKCTEVLAYHWTVTSGADRGRLFAVLRSLPSHFTVDFLELVETGKSATLVNALGLPREKDSLMKKSKCIASSSATNASDFRDNNSLNNVDLDESDADPPLTWRLNPKESFSDWKLEVKNLKYGAGAIYHVHRQVLAFGPRQSKLLADMFQKTKENESRTASITLGYTTAALVPQVLDFIYSPQNEIKIVSETAVTLRFLARYFKIWLLNEKILEFIVDDISLDNVTTYVSYCNTFDDIKVANIAASLCAKAIHSIDEESTLLRDLDPKFFVRVVSSEDIDREASSCHLSIIIAKYHTLHKLDESILESLVGVSQIPTIDCKSALKLLQIVDKLENAKTETFSNLCHRCLRVLTVNWNEFRDLNRGEIFSVLRGIDSELVSELFDNVEKDYHAERYNTMAMQSKLVKRYRKQLADEEQKRKDEVAALKKEMEETTTELSKRNSLLENQLRRHNDASNRRSVRSSSAYRSRIPSPRAASGQVPMSTPSTISAQFTPAPKSSNRPPSLDTTPSSLGLTCSASPMMGFTSRPIYAKKQWQLDENPSTKDELHEQDSRAE